MKNILLVFIAFAALTSSARADVFNDVEVLSTLTVDGHVTSRKAAAPISCSVDVSGVYRLNLDFTGDFYEVPLGQCPNLQFLQAITNAYPDGTSIPDGKTIKVLFNGFVSLRNMINTEGKMRLKGSQHFTSSGPILIEFVKDGKTWLELSKTLYY